MKKYFSLMLLGLLAIVAVSCNNDRTTDNDTYPVVLDIRENFVNSTAANTKDYLYGIHKQFTQSLPSTDVVLVYKQDNSSGTAVWKLLPKTYYLQQGNLDYHFDFTSSDVQIYADADFNQTSQDANYKNQFLNNQVFRVVLIPASQGQGRKAAVDYQNYNEVIKVYNIDDSHPTKL